MDISQVLDSLKICAEILHVDSRDFANADNNSDKDDYWGLITFY